MSSRRYDLDSILDKLQCPRGYQGCRIRPHLDLKATWLAEMYSEVQGRVRKAWQPLLTEANEVRTFAAPGEAQQALIEARGKSFTDSRPFIVQLNLGMPEESLWRDLISSAEKQAPGSLEAMIEDASMHLVAALRELRECHSQKRANELHKIAIGQSNRLRYLAQFANDEAERLQWLKIK